MLQLVESPTLPDPNNLFKWHMKLRGFDDSCSGAQVEHSVACLLSTFAFASTYAACTGFNRCGDRVCMHCDGAPCILLLDECASPPLLSFMPAKLRMCRSLLVVFLTLLAGAQAAAG